MYDLNPSYTYPLQEPVAVKRTEYKKLVAVFSVVVLCATLMSFVLGFDWLIWMEWFVGSFLIIFGSFKLIGYEDFVISFPTYDPIAAKSPLYNFSYPFIELFLGFLYVSDLAPIVRGLVAIIIFSVGSYGILKKISNDSGDAPCACLGNIIKLPLSTLSLLESALIATMAVLMLVSSFIF